MQLTPHFNESEFRSPHVRPDGTVDRVNRVRVPEQYHDGLRELCEALEVIREEAGGHPVDIVSGYRTAVFNRRNKGRAPNSLHLTARAADIRIRGMAPAAVFWLIDGLIRAGRIPRGGLAAYRTYVHYDVRGHRASWRPLPPIPAEEA